MTNEEAIYYLKSSGMSDEQIKLVIDAFTCEDCISRRAVEKITWEEPSYTDALNALTEVREKVRALPPVTPQQNMGRWIDIMVGDMPAQACDRCNTFYPLSYTGGGHRYCPNCGVKMEVEE